MKRRSLRHHFLPLMMLIVVMMIVVLFVYHAQVTAYLTDLTLEENTRLSRIYTREVDAQLASISSWLEARLANSEAAAAFTGQDEALRLDAKRELMALLDEGASLYPMIEAAFIIPPEPGETLMVPGASMDIEQYQTLMGSVEVISDFGRGLSETWSGVCVADGWNSFCALIDVGNVKVGALVSPQGLLDATPFLEEDRKHFALTKHNGFVLLTNLPASYGENIDLTGDLSGYYRTGGNGDILVCGAETEMGPFRLMMVVSEEEMLAGLRWTRWVMVLLIIVAAGVMAAMMFSLKRYILKPLDKTLKAIENYGQGQKVTLAVDKGDACEFAEIYHAFNTMTTQIEHLRIANYEEIIRKQKAELRFYQTQIRPHFMLNCLTTIHNLALTGNLDKLQAFTQAFSGFARTMFRADFAPVTVAQELQQVEYYISMQSIRLEDRVFCACQADAAARTATLPAMLIQTLVENCVKHGADAEGQVSIFVTCVLADRTLTVTVEDNGEGFSEAALQAVNTASASGFGLKNMCATLELLYGKAATLTAQNVPGAGSRVTVTIPQN